MSRDTTDSRASSGTVAVASGTRTAGSRRWWVLATLGIAQLMAVIDGSVVNIALPTAQLDLGFTDGSRQWVITAYALSFGSLLLLGGRLSDLFGNKLMFIIGVAGFAAASVVGGAATGFEMLVLARVVQGIFGALLAPAALSLLTTTFTEPKERGLAFGVFGAISGGGAAIGLLLGGVLTEYLSWRWTMYIAVVFAIPALIGAFIVLRRSRAAERPRLDLPGALTITAAVFLLVYGFSQAEAAGWGSPLTIAFLAGSAVLLVAFVLIQRRSAHPLFPLRIILDRNRAGGYLSLLFASIGMFGVFLFLTYYLQLNLGYSAVMTGLAFLPMCLMLVVVAGVGGALLGQRVSPKILVPAGMVFGALAMAFLTRIGTQANYVTDLLPSMILIGIGLGLVFSTGMNMATLGVAKDDAGVASAAVNTMQQVGGAIGIALLNTIAATAATGFLIGLEPTPQNVELAQIHSYTVGFWWSAGFFLAGAIICGLILRRGIHAPDPDAESVVVI